jgi:hypothetical protein
LSIRVSPAFEKRCSFLFSSVSSHSCFK